MLYVKAICVGLLSAAGTAALYLVVKIGWAYLYIRLVLVPRAEASGQSSWDASYPQSSNVLGPLVIGFVIGVWWMLRRRPPLNA